ncbi:hypothetical protein BC829DRAFT_490769 [Chytridium lagenaria]|nr:hypothetical protein BC829DRAFT_490769 [Chytridium lagenaria]
MPRVTLTPLPVYTHSYLREVERSKVPEHHLDNVAIVEFISDAQQRFYDYLFERAKTIKMEELGGEVEPFLTVNGDLQVAYMAQTHKYDTLRIHVGVISISRVAFRLSFKLTRERTASQNRSLHRLPVTDSTPSESITAAMAEIGVVQVDSVGRPIGILPELRKALVEVLEEQERGAGRLWKKF